MLHLVLYYYVNPPLSPHRRHAPSADRSWEQVARPIWASIRGGCLACGAKNDKLTPGRPMAARRGPQKLPRWLSWASFGSPWGPKTAHGRPKRAPRWPQRSKTAEEAPKIAPRRPRRAQQRPKRDPRRPKNAARQLNNNMNDNNKNTNSKNYQNDDNTNNDDNNNNK